MQIKNEYEEENVKKGLSFIHETFLELKTVKL